MNTVYVLVDKREKLPSPAEIQAADSVRLREAIQQVTSGNFLKVELDMTTDDDDALRVTCGWNGVAERLEARPDEV